MARELSSLMVSSKHLRRFLFLSIAGSPAEQGVGDNPPGRKRSVRVEKSVWGAVRKVFGGYSMPSVLGEWLHRMMH